MRTHFVNMEIKLVIFVIFGVTIGVISPVFGRPGPAENPPCYTKFTGDPLFFLLGTLMESTFKFMEAVQPNEALKLGKSKCETYDAMATVFNGISTGIGIALKANCSRISEIDELEKATLLASVQVVKNISVGFRIINIGNVDFGKEIDESEKKTNSELAEALHGIFKGLKIVLSKICPGNPLVQIENSIDSLNVTEQETTSAVSNIVRTLFEQIAKMYNAVSEPSLRDKGTEKKFSVVDYYQNKASEAITQWVRDIFNTFKNSLSKL